VTGRAAIILAAGEGKRMHSDLPKVLHRVAERPLLRWVLDAVSGAGFERTVVVIGREAERIRQAVGAAGVEFVLQKERRGTGHAVLQTEPFLQDFDGSVVVLSGDVPLIRKETLIDLVLRHEKKRAAATVVTAEMADPTGYGRIVRTPGGMIERIVEEKDAAPAERKIREVNAGTYCFQARALFRALPFLSADNAGGEYYLTDTIAVLREKGLPVFPFPIGDSWEVFGVNTQEHLRLLEERMKGRDDG